MTTRILGAGLITRIGRGLDAHAAFLKGATSQNMNLPPAIRFEVEEEGVEAPYHLAAPLDAGTNLQERFELLLDTAVEDALNAAGLEDEHLAEMAVYVGTSSADIGLIENALQAELDAGRSADTLSWYCSMDNLAPRLRDKYNLGIEGAMVNTACTASANAMIYADAAIRLGQVKHALVIGSEIFNATTALGFSSLDLLTQTAMRPFDSRRDGLVLGEAVSAAVIGPSTGTESGMHFLAGATLSDTYSISAANPDGSSIAQVMQLALERAGLDHSSIDAIKAHATASLLNDEGEAAGLMRVFPTHPVTCALKPFIGHTFGASGLTELLMLTACMDEGFWPANPGISEHSDSLGIALNQTPKPLKHANLLINQFGFGGNNTSLVMKHVA